MLFHRRGFCGLARPFVTVAMEIMHVYIVQFMFEDKSILHYMDNEQFDSYEKKHTGVQGRLN